MLTITHRRSATLAVGSACALALVVVLKHANDADKLHEENSSKIQDEEVPAKSHRTSPPAFFQRTVEKTLVLESKALPPVTTNQLAPPPGTGIIWNHDLLLTDPKAWSARHRAPLPSILKAELLATYNANTNLAVRKALAFGLVPMGDEEIARVICRSVTIDYTDAVLPADEAHTLATIMRSLLRYADVSPTTKAMARRGVEFEHWIRHPPFREAIGEDGQPVQGILPRLVSASIALLGCTSDGDVPRIIEELAARDIDYTYYTQGAIVGAAYDQQRLREGRGIIDADPNGGFAAFRLWLHNTPEGKKWKAWSDAIVRQRPTVKR